MFPLGDIPLWQKIDGNFFVVWKGQKNIVVEFGCIQICSSLNNMGRGPVSPPANWGA